MQKRKVDMVVISDVHLGTFGCRANELLQYLNSIEPGLVILNGDIVDIWQFRKSYWPKSHTLVIKKIFEFLSAGIPVYYLTGNHDEMLRRFSGLKVGNFHLKDKLLMELDGQEAWFFHGDVFDVTMQYSKWLAKLGAVGYDTLIMLNSVVNWCSERLGKGRISLSKKIKDSVKSAVKFINDFESVAADLAIDNRYAYVICGHIHQPNIKTYENAKGKVVYLNSGDWIENLTALEFNAGAWSIYKHDTSKHAAVDVKAMSEEVSIFELFKQNHSNEELVFLSKIIAHSKTAIL
ncbi:MAG: UDP-2,3-diacylglucosamine diphosphatase [Sphingobacteriaceae bacterium]|nr:UDP-2,3-diacylglucosamine diphosphatase [Sphingobacteriaceae bacterium]